MYNPYINPFQPNNIQPNQIYTSQAFPYLQQPQPQQNQNDLTYVLPVGSVKDFDAVTIQPGKKALLMAQNEPYIAFKSADQMGIVQTNLYKIEPVTVDQISQPETEYATKFELNKLQNVVQDILNKITEKNKDGEMK